MTRRSEPKKTPSVRLAGDQGMLTAGELLSVVQAMRDLGIDHAYLTSGQQLQLPGLTEDQAGAARERLKPLLATSRPMVQSCPGKAFCTLAQAETLPMARKLEELLASLDLPAKVKAGVSGCPRCCAESRVRDVGLVAKASGWTVCFGGNAGAKPRAGDVIAEKLPDGAALQAVRAALENYAREARRGERTARFMERTGRNVLP